MIRRLVSWLVVWVVLSSSVALAQEAPASPPTFRTSVALHLSAVIAGHAGTAMLAGGTLQLFGCALGGSACDGTVAVTFTGGALLCVSIALGIAASIVHSDTRAAREHLGVASDRLILPLVWLDDRTAGAGVVLGF